MTKVVLVTGATGFIGRQAIAPLADRGFEVHATYRKELPERGVFERAEWHKANLLNQFDIADVVGDIKPTHLMHFAWDVSPGYTESKNNHPWMIASLDLLAQFQRVGGSRAVFAGSCFEYDLNYGYCSETLTPNNPSTYYGACKLHTEDVGRQFSEKNGVSFACGRIFFPYGPYESKNRLAPSVINALLRNEPALCTHGNQVRDFMHTEDIGSAFAALLDSDVCGTVNISSGNPLRIREFVTKIAEELASTNLLQFGAIPAREGEPPFIVADVSRLTNEVGWKPRYSINEGIRETVKWWER